MKITRLTLALALLSAALLAGSGCEQKNGARRTAASEVRPSISPVRQDQFGGAPLELLTNPLLIRICSLAADPHSPVKFDTNVNEFQLVYSYMEGQNVVTEHIPLRYCPWSGVELPESLRSTGRLGSGDETRANSLIEKLQGISAIEDAERILGTPDYRYGPQDQTNEPGYYRLGPPGRFPKQITYTKLGKSLRLTIAEDAQGEVHVFTFPQ